MHKAIERFTLLNPGSMLPESTTTTGDSLPVRQIKPFHIISADVTTIPERVDKQQFDWKQKIILGHITTTKTKN